MLYSLRTFGSATLREIEVIYNVAKKKRGKFTYLIMRFQISQNRQSIRTNQISEEISILKIRRNIILRIFYWWKAKNISNYRYAGRSVEVSGKVKKSR